jgi:hypothetical protein
MLTTNAPSHRTVSSMIYLPATICKYNDRVIINDVSTDVDYGVGDLPSARRPVSSEKAFSRSGEVGKIASSSAEILLKYIHCAHVGEQRKKRKSLCIIATIEINNNKG